MCVYELSEDSCMLLPGACAGIQTQEQGGWKDGLILALSIKAQSL